MEPLILASTSPYRKELLSRLGLPFKAFGPEYKEVARTGAGAGELALENALGKALSLGERFPGSIVIGSDQCAQVDGEILGKPGTLENAALQLARMSGRNVTFHTGLALVRDGERHLACEVFEAKLKELTPAQIGAYLLREMPLDCAGSFKIEGLGIALMERLRGDDYTALMGLPLIRLVSLLKAMGVDALTGVEPAQRRCG